MAQQTRQRDLNGQEIQPGDWSHDDSQGVDYDLIFGGMRQYCFIEVEQDPLVLDFMAFGRTSERKVRSHPDLHTRSVPEEVLNWLTDRTYAHMENGVDTHRRFSVLGRKTLISVADEEGGKGGGGKKTVDLPLLETKGDIGEREQLTAFDLVRALAKGRIRPVEKPTDVTELAFRTSEKFDIGDRARDPESDDAEVIVLDTPCVDAAKYLIIETGQTVADYNEGCPGTSPNDPVVEVVFVESLDAVFGVGEWSVEGVLEMYEEAKLEDHVTRYAYPDGRLNNKPSHGQQDNGEE